MKKQDERRAIHATLEDVENSLPAQLAAEAVQLAEDGAGEFWDELFDNKYHICVGVCCFILLSAVGLKFMGGGGKINENKSIKKYILFLFFLFIIYNEYQERWR